MTLFAVGYFHYMLQQRRLSERAGKQGILSRAAFGLATLAVHKLQYGPLLAQGGNGPFPVTDADSPSLAPLFRELARPRSEMRPVTGQVDLEETATSDLFAVGQALTAPLAREGSFGFEIRYRCEPEDFEETGLAAAGYPREKRGAVRLTVVVRQRKGARPELVEEFQFRCRVKVTAALVPVLSKFVFYAEDMGQPGPGSFHGLNQVAVDENGEVLATSPARPLVFDADGDHGGPHGPLPVPTTWRDLVTGPRGLVYLGGTGTVVLNLAHSPPGNAGSGAGEGFQLFRRPNGDGFYKVLATRTPDGQPLDLFQMDVGMSPSPHNSVRLFYDLIREFAPGLWPAFRDTLRVESSSLLRPNGVDGNRSPTLVLGDVRSMTLLARIYAWPPLAGPPWNSPEGRTRERLFLYEEEDRFLIEAQTANGKLVPLVRAGLLSPIRGELARYLLHYSSFVASRSYNLGLAFAHNNRVPDPWTVVSESDHLYDFFRPVIPADALHGVPAPFVRAAPAGATLREMAPFLASLGAAGRVTHRIELPGAGDPDLSTALQRRGLLWRDVLFLDGLVVVSSADRRVVLERPWRFVGNGALVLEDGDWVVRAPLEPQFPARSREILLLAAPRGDIRLETPAGARVQASLVAGGRVVFGGGPGLQVTGNVVMKRFCTGPADLAGFPGGTLTYFPALAALPTPRPGTGEPPPAEQSEEPLLGFSFEPSPLVVE
ncbi:MAG: hypothetical protein GX442_06545 [Candidatus Riflebacteria bacterium]|nr:hypothetical protein [Candidatus Riflebacteria bacterium]